MSHPTEAEVAVAVAVVSWNSRAYLPGCLDSLRSAANAGVAEIWVVDNDSSDGSPELVEESYRWAHVLRLNTNLGFGAAVNEVAKHVSSTWIVAANADIEMCPDALEALLAAGERHAVAAAIAPRLVLPDGSVQRSVFSFPRLGTAILATAGIHRVRDSWSRRMWLEARWDPSAEQEVDYAMGAFLLVRRKAFDAVGGFDIAQWMFAEDLDLSWRLRRAGWATIFTPTATVRHIGAVSTDVAFGSDVTSALKLGAVYAWLGRRRGPIIMTTFAATNLTGALVRYVIAIGMRVVAPRRARGRIVVARAWLGITRSAWRARHTAAHSCTLTGPSGMRP